MKNITLLSTLCLLMFVFAPPSHSAAAKLSGRDKQYLLTGSFHTVHTVTAIPNIVRLEFAKLQHEATFQMADPGQPFQATDVVTGRRLPYHRLIFAAVSKDYCLIEYERGGIAYGCKAALFRLSNRKARYIWGADIPGLKPTLGELRKAIKEHALYNQNSEYV